MHTTSAESLLQLSLDRVCRNSANYGTLFPNVGDGQRYILRENKNWVAGFWPGMLWLTYAQTQNETVLNCAKGLLPSFQRRLDDNIHINHDLGFLFTLSARAQHMLTNDESAMMLAMRAANRLSERYRSAGKYIQAWGPVGEKERGGQIIMDTMMNLSLLFWASQESGYGAYRRYALDHARATASYLMRPDGSTFHTYFFDQESGKPLYGATHQGATDDSLWSRGQAWGILGFAIAAQWCPEETFLIETARAMTRRFMDELPDDDVPLWDLRLPEGAAPYRDSSAAAIALCGLQRLKTLDPTHAVEYKDYSTRLFTGIVKHCWDDHPEAEGLLKHGAQHVPKNIAPDGYTIFGDYYMLEALTLCKEGEPDFWGPTPQ